MKEVMIDSGRDKMSKSTVTSGEFSYEMIPDFCCYPSDEWQYLSVACGFCDREDNIYLIIRDQKHQIGVFDQNGCYVRDIPHGMIAEAHFGCETPEGNLIIADAAEHCFVEMDKEGNQIRCFGEPGVSSDTGFDMLRFQKERRFGSIVTPELRHTDTSGFAAWLYSQSTKVRTGKPFNRPTSVAFDSHGNYVFGDGYGNCAVHRFSSTGECLSTWGKPAFQADGTRRVAPGHFIIVHAVAVDSLDRVWVVDRESNAVTVYQEDGTIAAYIHGQLGAPSGAWFDGTYMYIGGCAGYITIFDMSFNTVANLGFFNSDIKVHGFAGNSRGDLFLFPTHAAPDHQCMCLRRIH